MNFRFLCLRCIAVILIVNQLLNVLEDGEVSAQSSSDVIDLLAEKWERQRLGLASGELTFFSFVQQAELPLSDTAFLSALMATDLSDSKERDKFARMLVPSLNPEHASVGETKLVFRGDSVFTSDSHDVGDRTVVQVGVDQIVKREYGSRDQVDLLPRGNAGFKQLKLDDIRYVPSQGNASNFRVADSLDTSTGAITLEASSSGRGRSTHAILLADIETGFIRQFRADITRTGQSAPFFTRLVVQQRPLEASPGIVFPSIFVDARFRNSELDFVQFRVVQNAAFNLPIEESAFVVPLKAGSVVVNQREDINNPGVVVAKTDADDSLRFADETEMRNTATSETIKESSSGRFYFLVTTFVMLVALMMAWFFLSKREGDKH